LELFKGIIKDLQLIVLVVAISYGLWRLFQPIIKKLKDKVARISNAFENALAMDEVYNKSIIEEQPTQRIAKGRV
jgi:hypothetical protein